MPLRHTWWLAELLSYQPGDTKQFFLPVLVWRGSVFSLHWSTLPSVSTTIATPCPSSEGDTTAMKDECDSICLLSAHFKHSVNVIVAQQRFSHHAEHKSEAVDEYMAALWVLIADCNFGSLIDEMQRAQLVSKTTRTCLREWLLFDGPSLTLSQAVTLADQYEQAVSQANEFCNDTSVQHVKERKSFLQSSEHTDEHACSEKRRAKACDHLLEYSLKFWACYHRGSSCKQLRMSGASEQMMSLREDWPFALNVPVVWSFSKSSTSRQRI